MSDLYEAQIALEEDVVKLGVERYRQQVATRKPSDLPPGLRLVRQSVEPVAQRIDRDKEAAFAGTPSKHTSIFFYLDQFNSDTLAYVVARTVISNLFRNPSLTWLANRVTDVLEDSINYDIIKEANPVLYRHLMRKLQKTNSERYKHVIVRSYQRKDSIRQIKWDKTVSEKIGLYLIDILVEETGFAYYSNQIVVSGNRRPYIVQPTEAALEWFEKAHGQCELLHPFHMPMIARPKAWSTPFNGGYYTKALKYPLIKTANRNYLQELEWVEMPMVYKAINALQDTAWKINRPVLRVIEEAWEAGLRIGKLPSSQPVELPPKTVDFEVDIEALKQWKKDATKVYDYNFRNTSKRVLGAQRIAIARRFYNADRFYFPYSLDTRGRAYPVSSVLSPQGDDVSKAMLTFADALPLGENGRFWLYVHGANCFGVDKVDFESRTEWVQEHHNYILDSALNPLDGTRFWQDADDPFQFLAFCFAYTGLELHLKSGGDASDYLCDLPISLDGSCNGLQNFSAMLLDEVGGAATNLVPSDKPSDLYGEVAKVCSGLIQEDIASGEPMAVKWEGKVTRKLVKRNTMTVPYAVTINGMKKQLLDEFKDMAEMEDDDAQFASGLGWEDASYLALRNHTAIGRIVVAARKAMEWLQKAARVASSNGLPVQWVTPSGLPVLQFYKKTRGKRANIRLNGKRFQLTIRHDTEVLDTRKQALGIAPNFVHSQDAAHMHRTVCYCVDAGVNAFSMVHDSYGVHACQVDTLSYQLRKGFVDQYSGDVLADFAEQLKAQLPAKIAAQIPELPKKGTLDLQQVMESDYFFA
jgi:DNA-directed RNA polymerase